MSVTRLALPAVVAAFLLSGCSDESSATQIRGPLTTAELTWIRAESVWAIAIYDEELGPPPGAALVVDPYWGANNGGVSGTYRFDDTMASNTVSDYPLRDTSILAMRPDAAGTHVTPGTFQNDDRTTNVESEIVKPTASVATVPAKMAKNESQPTMNPAIGW